MFRIAPFVLPALLVAAATAQTWSSPMNPRATYLRTNNDSPLPPLVLDLAAFGAAPGQWLRIQATGAFRYVNGGQDNGRSMCAVFSASTTLLATNVQQRVPDAIAAGPAFLSGGTFSGGLPMDVPQDFFVSRTLWGNQIDVQVPAGAAHLFLGVHDSLYNDNVDPNGDWGVIVTVIPTPTLPGTGEHLTMKSAVNGTPANSPDVHVVQPGATLTTELAYPLGLIDGSLYLVVADVVTIGSPVPNPLPGLWSQNLILLKAGLLPSTPDFTDTWSIVVAPGFSGTAVVVQGLALADVARNGLFESTNAHLFLFQ